jgi:sortase A
MEVKARRYIQILGWTLIWIGVFIFGYVGWQLYVTDLLNARVQAEALPALEDHFDEVVSTLPEVEPIEVGEPGEHILEGIPAEDAGFAVLRVPRVGLEVVVFEGVGSSTLAKGPGHLPGTPLPGQPGNSVISGHRTTYGRPFHDFDLLAAGDRLEVETGIGTHVYEIRDTFIVAPTDVWVADTRPGAWLTLTTCNPKYSARERLIVTAELVDGPNLAYVRALDEVGQAPA